ncbi:MAG: hypothetical protein JXA30_11915 [Deltaproteobacteria bacterium]|nr:hypothetical protein [Deltaproteobacteria bacterium]
MDLLEQVASLGGRLLRVERYAEAKKREAGTVPALLLTFDVGRILIWASAAKRELVLEMIADREELPSGLIKLDEEEPWWRVLGSPLAAARAEDDRRGYRLQFRQDNHNPRHLSLTVNGDTIQVRIKKPSTGCSAKTRKSFKT